MAEERSYYSKYKKILVPGLQNSQYVYLGILTEYLKDNIAWLDLGCGHQFFPEWIPESFGSQEKFAERSGLTVGLDYDAESIKMHRFLSNGIVGDIQSVPFADQSFDLITANMVMEHVRLPGIALTEIRRILKPKGIVIFHTPNLFNYLTMIGRIVPDGIKKRLIKSLEGRENEDVFPTYYRMNTSKTIRKYASRAGFEIVDMQYLESSAETQNLGRLVIFELLLIKLLRLSWFKGFRTTIIAILRKS